MSNFNIYTMRFVVTDYFGDLQFGALHWVLHTILLLAIKSD